MESVAIPEHLIKLLPVAEPGIFDLVGYVISAVEGNPYQSVFYNGNIEVVKQGKMWRGMDVLIFNGWHWWTHIDHIQPYVGLHGRWKQIIQRHEQTSRLLQRDDHLGSIGMETNVLSFVLKTGHDYYFDNWKGLGRANEVMRLKNPVYWLDITGLSQLRKDAHPSSYSGNHPGNDSHWCLPGLPDTWNILFYSALFS
ncbi:hypothetical protein Bca4012_076282 [Brassica carinata]